MAGHVIDTGPQWRCHKQLVNNNLAPPPATTASHYLQNLKMFDILWKTIIKIVQLRDPYVMFDSKVIRLQSVRFA